MPSFPHTFSSLGGNVPASYLDDNFAVCAFAADLSALEATVTALPGTAIPLKPVAAGSAGSALTLSKVDHQHPPQQADLNAQVGTSYTLASTDDGKMLALTNAAAITLTLPNSLLAGNSGIILQGGAGQITFTAGAGSTIRQRQSFTKTAGQYALVTWVVWTGTGANAVYVLSGDMAT